MNPADGEQNQAIKLDSLERKWILSVSLVYMALTIIPYLFGWSIRGDRFYTAFHYNADDFCVYTAWMTQAKQGHFLLDNRFTTDPQPRLTVHLLFWTLGTSERFTNLPPQIVLHGARFIFGVLMIIAFYRFARRTLASDQSARLAVYLALLSSGFGWLMWKNLGWESPADVWQPELITFPSLLLNPLFAASGWLILEVWNSILDAEFGWKPVIWGAAAIGILANIHTYDIVPIAVVSLLFAIGLAIFKKLNIAWTMRVFVIFLGTLPALLWFAYVLQSDPVFQARAQTLTFSEPLWKYIVGFGGILICAAGGLYSLYKQPFLMYEKAKILVPIWAVAGFALPYIPTLFQRKLWMGLHWPLCLLAAAFLTHCFGRYYRARYNLAVILVLAMLSITNIFWIRRDLEFLANNTSNTTIHPPFLSPEQEDVINWLVKNSKAEDGVATLPNFACYIAAYAGNKVYVGHWSETPDFEKRLKEVNFGLLSSVGSEHELRILAKSMKVKYIINLAEPFKTNDGKLFLGADLSFLGRVVYSNKEYKIYQITR